MACKIYVEPFEAVPVMQQDEEHDLRKGDDLSLLRNLGNSDLRLSPIGIGAWALGGDGWHYSLGPQDDKDSIALIHSAVDFGINWIDTAGVYGYGRAGRTIARALKSVSKRPYIFMKVGVRWHEDGSLYNSLRADSLIEEVELALRRWDIETLDLCQIHWPQPEREIEEGWETLARLREQGKIRWIGVSNFSVAQMKRVQNIAPITSLQPPYSALARNIEAQVLPFTQSNGIGVISYSPMCSGLLTGTLTAEAVNELPAEDARRRLVQFREPRLSRNLRLVELLCELGRSHNVSPGVIAVAWVLHNSAITGAIVGCRNQREMEEVAPALEFRLSQSEYEAIRSFHKSMRWILSSMRARLLDAWEMTQIPFNRQL